MSARTPIPADAQAVVDHWFGAPESAVYGRFRAFWFQKRAATDHKIARLFGARIERALHGEYRAWGEEPTSALAQVLLLDQFTRNTLRGSARAFEGDAQALSAATSMVDSGQDQALLPVQRIFAYLPFEHAENLIAQNESVRLFTRLAEDGSDSNDLLKYALKHREIIARFGRFPHRNAPLGRQSTPQELAYLQEPGSRF